MPLAFAIDADLRRSRQPGVLYSRGQLSYFNKPLRADEAQFEALSLRLLEGFYVE